MAYTRNYDKTQPDGSEQAATIDNEIRNHKEDLEERLLTLISDIDTDPLVDNIGVPFNKHVCEGSPTVDAIAGNTWLISAGNGFLIPFGDSGSITWCMGITNSDVPNGCSLVTLALRVGLDTGSQCTAMEFSKIAMTTGVKTQISTPTGVTGGGWQGIVLDPASPEVMDYSANMYFIHFNLINGTSGNLARALGLAGTFDRDHTLLGR